jgi:RNA polymerase sigma-70 factor, ECF subfamily
MQALMPVLPNLERFVRALVIRSGSSQAERTEVARDLLSETIAQAFEKFETVRYTEAFLSFCFTIATRIHRREMQKSRRFTALENDKHEYIGAAEGNLENADVSLLYAALDTLPTKQREAVIMFEILGFSMKEICEVQGGTVIATKVRISRGRAELTRLLNENKTMVVPKKIKPETKNRTPEKTHLSTVFL